MKVRTHRPWLLPSLVSGFLLLASASSALAASNSASKVLPEVRPLLGLTQPITDLGPADPNQIMTMSIVLKLQNQSGLASYIEATQTPGSPDFHKFLSVPLFRNLYAPAGTVGAAFVSYLTAHHIQAYVYPDGLLVKAIGPASAFEQLFSVAIENFSSEGQDFYGVTQAIKFPKSLQKYVLTTIGLDNFAGSAPQMLMAPKDGAAAPADDSSSGVTLPKHGTANGIPGEYTVGDVADMYDVNPLYDKGIKGAGETIGIATFANFPIANAYYYWRAIHLPVKPNRVTQVFVDGGGQIGASAGSAETALDVEQSGGLAPDANIVVYDAANTDEGFNDVFYEAASENVVSSLSVSWGSPELFYLAGGQQGELQAMNQAFMEAAVQGISVFAAAGDSGAYDVNAAVPYPFISKVVSVDAPSSDPYVTATGGTTHAGTIKLLHGTVDVPQTSAWGWDYLANYIQTYYGQYGLYTKNVFPTGGGGGVSAVWPVPFYQKGIPSIQTTAPNQHLIDNTQDPPTVDYSLPSGFAGRNTPDIALNADPYTGYLVYSTPDGGWLKNVGGTSLTAPQMNGITALLDESLGTRLGLLNPALYTLARENDYGPGAPLMAITSGDNWYYEAIPGYNQATGVGSPDVASLADWMKAAW